MLQCLDRYPMNLQSKGMADVFFNPEIIILTSNVHPNTWYGNVPDEVKKALIRRMFVVFFPFSYIIDFKSILDGQAKKNPIGEIQESCEEIEEVDSQIQDEDIQTSRYDLRKHHA